MKNWHKNSLIARFRIDKAAGVELTPAQQGLLSALVFTLLAGRPVFADSGYEPCHLLCANEAGRVEAPSTRGALPPGRFGLRLETAFISPKGHYEEGKYVPLRDGAHVQSLEFLPVFWYRPNDSFRFNLGMPWEINRATRVVLPTLHPNDGTTGEFAPGGVFASANFRISVPEEWPIEPWVGIGYKLSSPQGTSDVSDFREFPDKAVEGLGVGSDDIYFPFLGIYKLEKWRFELGGELRFHMLPRWERLYATTTAYQTSVSYRAFEESAFMLKFSGYYTALRVLGTSQLSTLIALSEATWFLSPSLNLSFGVSGEVPGTSINQNSLQTIRFHSAVAIGF